MPTYDYVCTKCGARFEYFQSMSAEALKECPEEQCMQQPWGHGTVVRQIGAGAGLIFNGSGFYLTDYKNASPAKSASSSTVSSNSSTSGASAGSSSAGTSSASSGSGSAPVGE